MKRVVKLGNFEGIAVQLRDIEFLIKYGLPREKEIGKFCLDINNIEEINPENRDEWLTFYHFGLPKYFSELDWIIYENHLNDLSSYELGLLFNQKVDLYSGPWSYKYGYERKNIIKRLIDLIKNESPISEIISCLFSKTLSDKQIHILKTIGLCYVNKLIEEEKDFPQLEVYNIIQKSKTKKL